MGQCCNTRSDYCDNEFENFYRDIIHSFPKHSYSELKKHLSKLQLSDAEEDNYSEERYLMFKNNLLPKSTGTYAVIHKNIIPDWEIAWQLAYKENLTANILLWGFGFIKEESALYRYEILMEILACTESYFDTTNFLEFLWHYLNTQLIYINNVVLKSIVQNAKSKKSISIGGKKVNSEMIQEMEQTYLKLSNKLYFKRFKQSLEIEVIRIYMKNTDYDSSNIKLEGAFTKKMFMEFSKEYGYLWNPLQLRIQYYNFINDNLSVSVLSNY